MDSALDLTSKSSLTSSLTTDVRQTTPSPITHHYETPSPSPPGSRSFPEPLTSSISSTLPSKINSSILPTSLNSIPLLGAPVFPGSPDHGDLSHGRASSPPEVGVNCLPVPMATPGHSLLTALSGTAALLAGARHIENERLRQQQLVLLEQHKLRYNLAMGVLAPATSVVTSSDDQPIAKRARMAQNSARLSTPPASDSAEDSTAGTSYWERRRRNNQAAKRSRDSRRVKEEVLASRAAQLERENLELKAQVEALRSQTAKLHEMLYSDEQCPPSNSSETPATEIDMATATAIAVAAQATPISITTPLDYKSLQRQALNV